MWEYDRIEIKFRYFSELVNKLNEIGNEDWEIINYEEIKPKKSGENTQCIIIVKRQKKQ